GPGRLHPSVARLAGKRAVPGRRVPATDAVLRRTRPARQRAALVSNLRAHAAARAGRRAFRRDPPSVPRDCPDLGMMPVPPPAVRSTPGADAPATPQDFVSPRVAGAAAATPVASAQQVTPFAPTNVDSSSPEAFIRSIAPYAARVSKATGIPAAAMIGMAANET